MRLTEKTDSGSWCLRDVPWDQLKPGAVITEKTWEKLYGALWKLKDYEDTGLSPEEVENVNNFEKNQTCKMMVKMQEEREKHRWIPVTERLPEEHDSIFAKLNGTAKWRNGMFKTRSDDVLVTVKYEDGMECTEQAHTTDGVWKTAHKVLEGKVVAWMPFPEPHKEHEEKSSR